MLIIRKQAESNPTKSTALLARARLVLAGKEVVSPAVMLELLKNSTAEYDRLELGLRWWIEVKMKYWRDCQYGKAVMRRVLDGSHITDVAP